MKTIIFTFVILAMCSSAVQAETKAPATQKQAPTLTQNQAETSKAYQNMVACMENAVGKEAYQSAQQNMASNMIGIMPQLRGLCEKNQFDRARALLRAQTETPDAKLVEQAIKKCEKEANTIAEVSGILKANKDKKPSHSQETDIDKMDMNAYCKSFRGQDFEGLQKKVMGE
jgi:hypothetical protein